MSMCSRRQVHADGKGITPGAHLSILSKICASIMLTIRWRWRHVLIWVRWWKNTVSSWRWYWEKITNGVSFDNYAEHNNRWDLQVDPQWLFFYKEQKINQHVKSDCPFTRKLATTQNQWWWSRGSRLGCKYRTWRQKKKDWFKPIMVLGTYGGKILQWILHQK